LIDVLGTLRLNSSAQVASVVAVHLEGTLFADDASLVRFVEHVDAADSGARVPAGSRLEFGFRALGGSFRGNLAVGVAPEHASAAHRATA
jgi:hypothetical protein